MPSRRSLHDCKNLGVYLFNGVLLEVFSRVWGFTFLTGCFWRSLVGFGGLPF